MTLPRNFDELIDRIQKYPSMFAGTDNCEDVFLFISGVACGMSLQAHHGPLDLFAEWLDLEDGSENAFWWIGRLSAGDRTNAEKLKTGFDKIRSYRQHVQLSSEQELRKHHHERFRNG